MKIGILGVGYVGLVTGVCLAEIGHTVKCYDIDSSKIYMLNDGKSPIYEKDLVKYMRKNKDRLIYTSNEQEAFKNLDIIFIAVGTPELDNGMPDLSHIYNACETIKNNINKDCLVVIKSTVPVGTALEIQEYFCKNSTFNIEVVSNPEFLSQGTAIQNTLYATRIIIGSNNIKAINTMKTLYKPLLEYPYKVPFLVVSQNSAEMIKYSSNDFLALKLSYINEIANLCKEVDADIEEVKEGMKYDSRIGGEYLNAGIGFGGSCLPKDTKALYQIGKLELVNSTINVNKNQNILLFNELLKDFNNNISNKRIGVLGLTFKPGTDDVRYSPAIKNIELLLKEGAIVNAYDPVGISNFKKHMTHNNLLYFTNIIEAIKDCDAIIIVTDWPEIKNLPIPNIIKNMKTPRIYDGRNCFSLHDIKQYRVYYSSIGRRTIDNINNIHKIEKESD